MDNDQITIPRLSDNLLIHSGALVDAYSLHSPGAIYIKDGQIAAAGTPQEIGEIHGVTSISCPGEVIMPGFVNTHAHLDLTSIGPVGAEEGFSKWLDRIRMARPTEASSIAKAVHAGVQASLAGGTIGIGDISGAHSWAPFEALCQSYLSGTSWVEVFGIAAREDVGIEAIDEIIEKAAQYPHGNIRPGLSPHAPTSCGVEVYRHAARSGLPLATHLAESIEELDFMRFGKGPMKDLLVDLDIWGAGIPPHGAHPIDVLADACSMGAWTIAHVNYPSLAEEGPEERQRRIDLMSTWNAVIAYCPRASAFFGHPHGGEHSHPWRDFLEAGIPVALGTDGMPCLDTPDRLSILDEMRWLVTHNDAHWRELMPMATIHGARAVGIDPDCVDLKPGPIAGLLAVVGEGDDPVADAFSRKEPIRWIGISNELH